MFKKNLISDVLTILIVFSILLLILFPLPTFLLDILIAVNLIVAIILILISLFIKNTSSFFVFPTILLLTTLFRLGLNISSTRLILLQADAGDIINSFGNFLIRGEILVGIIIFIIITIVNFVVIAKGTSRVSEVSARFALESLSGKQADIESELLNGIIDHKEAKKRRLELREESQLFGNMDGAMKFVQGDAIAGFFITITNIIGGVAIGLKNSLPLDETLTTYTTLTIGDGLVSQIPALLISICAGIIVTRISNSNSSSFGVELVNQIFKYPSIIVIASVMTLILSFLPGLPFLPFLIVTIGILSLLFFKKYFNQTTTSDSFNVYSESESEELFSDSNALLDYTKDIKSSKNYNIDSKININLSNNLFKKYKNYKNIKSVLNNFYDNFYASTGLYIPIVSINNDHHLEPNEYTVNFNDQLVFNDYYNLDDYYVKGSKKSADFLSLPLEDSFKSLLKVKSLENSSNKLASYNLNQLFFLDVIFYKILQEIYNQPNNLIDINYINSYIKNYEKNNLNILEATLDKNFFNLSRITLIIQELIREKVNIISFSKLLEILGKYTSTYASNLVKEDYFDIEDIINFIREGLKRNINTKFKNRNHINIIKVDSSVETAIEQHMDNLYELKDKECLFKVKESLKDVEKIIFLNKIDKIIIASSKSVRYKLSRLFKEVNFQTPIISFNEIESDVDIRVVGLLKI